MSSRSGSGATSSPGSHGVEAGEERVGVEVDLGEREGIRADRFDTEGFELTLRKVPQVVGDDGGGGDVYGEGEDVAVLGVDRHRVDE